MTPGRIQPSPNSSGLRPPSPDIPLSRAISRPSRRPTLRTPLSDLQIPVQSPVTPSITFRASTTATTAATGRIYTNTPLSSKPSQAPAGSRVSISTCTPSRTYPAHLHTSTPASHASSPPVPPGARDLPNPGEKHPAGQSRRRGSLRHPEQAANRAPLVPMTPVMDRLVRSGTLRLLSPALSMHAHVRADMRPPSAPPSSTGKPMSLKDRRALLLDDHSVSARSYLVLCFRSRSDTVCSGMRARGSYRLTTKRMKM